MKLAYSLLEVKSIDEDDWTFEGIATTPTPDRVDDVVEPKGAEFTLPVPFLWQHDKRQPIGQVVEATVTDEGIAVKFKLTKPDEVKSEKLKERLQEAYDSIKTGLVRGLSIGFRGIEVADIQGTWGYKFIKWDWYELSAVTIPANQEATITSVKALSQTNQSNQQGEQQQEKSVVCKPPSVRSESKHLVVKLTDTSKSSGVKLV